MRHDDEVELGKIKALCLSIVSKDVWIVAGIEENALSAIFDQGCVAPIFLQRGRFAGVYKLLIYIAIITKDLGER